MIFKTQTALKFLVLCASISILSCQSDNDVSPDLDNTKVASISGIGDFEYKNDLLQSLGEEDFLYDNEQKLIGSTSLAQDTSILIFNGSTVIKDTTVHIKYQRYSYLWAEGQIKAGIIDTILVKSLKQGNLNTSLITQQADASYFYTGDRLDSVKYFGMNEGDLKQITYEYGEDGNIKNLTQYYISSLPSTSPRKVTYEITEYDSHLNPYYLLYKQTGVILNQLKRRNISRNNPLKGTMKVTVGPGETALESEFVADYEYNELGLPIKAVSNKGTATEVSTLITYK